MYFASEENRSALICMSEKIFNLRPPLTHLDFHGLFDSEETAQQGGGLLHALTSTITKPTLLSLNLGRNDKLWTDEGRFGMLLDVLQLQYNLEDLNLAYSYFSAEQTE